MKFAKAHAYGNDFIYVEHEAVRGVALDELTRIMCDRHTGVGADGLIAYRRTSAGASMTLFNADGRRAEVSGNGVRGLAALVAGSDHAAGDVTIETDAGPKRLTRIDGSGRRPLFCAAMGLPTDLRQIVISVPDGSVEAVVMKFGNPHCVIVGPMPLDNRFRSLGAVLERHPLFPDGTNVEFAEVERPDRVRILIWERGVGATMSSGTGSCAALVGAATVGGAGRDATIVAPGGPQRVEWRDDSVYLTGWAEVVYTGEWLGELPRG